MEKIYAEHSRSIKTECAKQQGKKEIQQSPEPAPSKQELTPEPLNEIEKQEIPEPISENETENPEVEPSTEQETNPTFFERNYKRIRINEKEKYTFKLLLELEAQQAGREYLTSDITALSKRSQCIEARYLKTLWEQKKINREWKNRQYYYTLAPEKNGADTSSSKTVSQNPLSNPQTQEQQAVESRTTHTEKEHKELEVQNEE